MRGERATRKIALLLILGTLPVTLSGCKYSSFDEYLEGDGVCLIEWAELVDELIPEGAVRIKIEKDLSRGTDIMKITIVKAFALLIHLIQT